MDKDISNNKTISTREDKKIKSTVALINDNKKKLQFNNVFKKCIGKPNNATYDNIIKKEVNVTPRIQ